MDKGRRRFKYFTLGLLIFGVIFFAIMWEVNKYIVRIKHEQVYIETECHLEKNREDFKLEY